MAERNAFCRFDVRFHCDYYDVDPLNTLSYFLQRSDRIENLRKAGDPLIEHVSSRKYRSKSLLQNELRELLMFIYC